MKSGIFYGTKPIHFACLWLLPHPTVILKPMGPWNVCTYVCRYVYVCRIHTYYEMISSVKIYYCCMLFKRQPEMVFISCDVHI